ncbi:hypothetical protein KKC36_00945 [Patescibacteria group bacterium]|nr:hypothetical protein [Patescibacteria group bacterium]
MSKNFQNNLCPLCGKQRIVVKTYKEKIGNSVITYTEKICPDPVCQKKLDGQLAQEQKKRNLIIKAQKKREEERKKRLKDKKAGK